MYNYTHMYKYLFTLYCRACTPHNEFLQFIVNNINLIPVSYTAVIEFINDAKSVVKKQK